MALFLYIQFYIWNPMMKRLASLLLVLSTLSGCANITQLSDIVKKPTISYQSIALGQVSAHGIELKPTFSLLNNNSYAIPVDTVDYHFSLNGDSIVSGVTQPIGSLSPHQARDITVSINIADKALKSLQGSLFSDKAINYNVNGHVNVMGIALPFEHQATIFVPQIKLGKITMVNANMRKLDLVVNVIVENNNDFVLPLDNINYSIATAGRDLVSGQLVNQQISQGVNQLQLPISIETSKLVTSLFAVMRQPNIPLQIKIESPLFSVDKTQSINLKSLF